MYTVVIEDNRDGFCEVVAEFDTHYEATAYIEKKVVQYLGNNYSAFIEYSEADSDYGYEYHNDYAASRCGWYDDEDPIYDYYGEVEEQRYWDRVFATPQSMVDHYFPNWYPSSALVDAKNFWYLGILRTLGGNHALHQSRSPQ